MALDTKAGIIAALDAIDNRTYGGPLVGKTKTPSKGVIRYKEFEAIVLDISEAIANRLTPGAGVTAFLNKVTGLRSKRLQPGVVGGRVGVGLGANRSKDVLSGSVVSSRTVISVPLNARTFDTVAVELLRELAGLVGDGSSDVSAIADAIDIFDNASAYDGDGADLSNPRRGRTVRRGETQQQFQESIYDALRVLAEALA